VADVARLVARVRHMAGRQHRRVPVGRGMAQAAVVRRDLLSGGVIGGADLQAGARRPHVEGEARLVAIDASGPDA